MHSRKGVNDGDEERDQQRWWIAARHPRPDELYGLEENDKLWGLAGHDVLHDDAGDDVLISIDGGFLKGCLGADMLIGDNSRLMYRCPPVGMTVNLATRKSRGGKRRATG